MISQQNKIIKVFILLLFYLDVILYFLSFLYFEKLEKLGFSGFTLFIPMLIVFLLSKIYLKSKVWISFIIFLPFIISDGISNLSIFIKVPISIVFLILFTHNFYLLYFFSRKIDFPFLKTILFFLVTPFFIIWINKIFREINEDDLLPPKIS